MIGYLIKSTVCLAIVLLVYLLALEREKMHRFNRVYLLFGLLLALIIPFLPSGEVIYQTYSTSPVIFNDSSGLIIQESAAEIESFAWLSWERLLFTIYSMVLAVMLIKFVRNIFQLINKASSNPKVNYQNAQLVLLKEEILPHTFLGYIYVNEDQYHNEEIDEKLLAHEFAHANQRHSWDVIIIELLKAIFWFNPLFLLYKRVIQLNHEFLADEAVIQQYNDVSNYQHLLVDACQNNNQIYLASNINYLLTKKRLTMMTKHSSRKRIYMLMAGVIPMAIALVMLLGQPMIAQTTPNVDTKESSRPKDKDELRQYKFMRGIGLKIPSSFSPNGDGKNEVLMVQTGGADPVKSYQLIIYNMYGEIVFQSEDPKEAWNGKVGNTQGEPIGGIYAYYLFYIDIDDLETNKKGEVKLIMDPDLMIEVLDGNKSKKVKITDVDTIPTPPTPPKAPNAPNPPKAPNAPNPPNAPNAPNPPKAPSPPKPPKSPKSPKASRIIPPSPPAPQSYEMLKEKSGSEVEYVNGVPLYKGKTVRELAEAGAEIYVNGKLLLDHVAKTLCDDNGYSSYLITTFEDGTMKVELEN